MRFRHPVLTIALAAICACGGDAATAPISPNPPAPSVLLKDIVIPNLPSPFYHFEYDGTGRIDLASFASGFARYDVKYDAGRLSEMRNSSVDQGTLTYSYDASGRVDQVSYVRRIRG
jgi:hypothetical protein